MKIYTCDCVSPSAPIALMADVRCWYGPPEESA